MIDVLAKPGNGVLDNPVPTKEKRLAAFSERMAGVDLAELAREKKQHVIPGIDCLALSRQYGMERAHLPQKMEGTFKVPVGISEKEFREKTTWALATWVKVMEKQGWEFVSDRAYPLQVVPGTYPAYEVNTNLPLVGQREMLILAWFRKRSPRRRIIEVPRELLEPTIL